MMRFWFYVYQGEFCVAKGFCSSKEMAEKEADHYRIQYAQDGPVKVIFRKVFSRKRA
jgi:hypothetical protein